MSTAHTDHLPRLEVQVGVERHILSPAATEHADSIGDVLRRAGLPLNTRCGGRGLCNGCFVEVLSGILENSGGQQIISAATQSEHPIVRGCECRMDGQDVTIRVPQRSSMRYEPQIVSDYEIRVPFSHDPLVQGPGVGVAIDIGTTTVALMLVDLVSGAVICRASRFNEQIHLGEDVVTRINLCATDPDMVGQMQECVAKKTILPLLEQTLNQSNRPIEDVRCFVLAGNTTMLHLLAGVDPTPLGTAPFTPVFLEHRVMSASEIFADARFGETVKCHLLPGAAAYVGADLTAGIVATGLLYEDGPSLLIDVGTNGEIILKHGKELVGCATAAGPAFEGARLASGMRAVNGAISHVMFKGDPVALECDVIGDGHTRPLGICGSAYVDFLARAHEAGLLNDVGRFNTDIPGDLADRLLPVDQNDMAFRLATGPGKQPVVITGCDVASLLQAKAAIAAGIITLLNQFNLQPQDICNVYLAGGFGTKMDRSSAIACGLLPGFRVDQVHAVGNSSLAGAYLCLIDSNSVAEARSAAQVRIVELNLDPSFEMNYIDQLCLG